MDKLCKIFEDEDLFSLSLLDISLMNQLDKSLVEHIIQMGEFSAQKLSKYSMEIAIRYIELCNLSKGKNIYLDRMKYITKLQNELKENPHPC